MNNTLFLYIVGVWVRVDVVKCVGELGRVLVWWCGHVGACLGGLGVWMKPYTTYTHLNYTINLIKIYI